MKEYVLLLVFFKNNNAQHKMNAHGVTVGDLGNEIDDTSSNLGGRCLPFAVALMALEKTNSFGYKRGQTW